MTGSYLSRFPIWQLYNDAVEQLTKLPCAGSNIKGSEMYRQFWKWLTPCIIHDTVCLCVRLCVCGGGGGGATKTYMEISADGIYIYISYIFTDINQLCTMSTTTTQSHKYMQWHLCAH